MEGRVYPHRGGHAAEVHFYNPLQIPRKQMCTTAVQSCKEQ